MQLYLGQVTVAQRLQTAVEAQGGCADSTHHAVWSFIFKSKW